MTISRRVFLAELRDLLILILVGFVMTYLMPYNRSAYQFWVIGSFTACMWVFLWKGNTYLSDLLWRKIDWLRSPSKTFVVGFVLTVLLTAGIVYALVTVFEWVFNINFGSISSLLYSTIILTIIITFFMNGRAFLIAWKRTAMDAEALKRESITAQYESLKNQVNPHFLFNSLNALINLVYEDQDKAAKFIKQLSEVYRYVLDTRDKEVVPLEEEIKFLRAYIFLQQIRFGDKMKLEIGLDHVQSQVAPLVLQMLIENAIKHNVIAEDQPLTIRLFQEDRWIVVENSVQRKSVLPEDSPGIGLENIRRRYSFLSDRKMEVIETGSRFVVKLPIL